jgi:predicted nucleic acid-binding protein
MRAVLDTNILLSGIHWPGIPEKVLRAWFSGKFELVASLPIIDELMDILISFKIPLSPDDCYCLV